MNEHSGCGLVIFGASGDLCNRKLLPALLELSGDNKLSDDFKIFGVGRTERSDEAWRQEAAAALQGMNYPPEVLERFLSRLHYRVLQYDSVADFDRLYEELNQMGIDTMLDDRDERPGAKFNDMELRGIPIRITILIN